MSVVTHSESVTIGNPKAQELAEYLQTELVGSEELYFKGKFIADEVGLSPKEIGSLIPMLQEKLDSISIEAWSCTGATTWRATRG